MEHKNIPDNQLHLPKGASGAGEGEVFVADGDGGGTFKRLSSAYSTFEDTNVQQAIRMLRERIEELEAGAST